MLSDTAGLYGLFFSAFISATLFPGGSEAVLAYLTSQSEHPPVLLLGVATAGNTLGGMSSWLLGWWIATRYPLKSLSHGKAKQAVQRLRKWGSPILLFSWLPVIGDPLCLAAGWLRVNWVIVLLFVALGKAARYVVVMWLTPV